MAIRDELPGKPETGFPFVNQLQSQITKNSKHSVQSNRTKMHWLYIMHTCPKWDTTLYISDYVSRLELQKVLPKKNTTHKYETTG